MVAVEEEERGQEEEEEDWTCLTSPQVCSVVWTPRNREVGCKTCQPCYRVEEEEEEEKELEEVVTLMDDAEEEEEEVERVILAVSVELVPTDREATAEEEEGEE